MSSKTIIKENTLYDYLRTQLEPEILHELCTQYDDGRFVDTMDKLLEIDSRRFPNEYTTP
jgi:hypothetical protein